MSFSNNPFAVLDPRRVEKNKQKQEVKQKVEVPEEPAQENGNVINQKESVEPEKVEEPSAPEESSE